jgi:hypothetical protein
MSNQKKKYVNVGILCKRKDGGFYIKVDKDSGLSIGGQDFSGQYINVSKPTEKYDRMLKAGKITEDEYNEKIDRYSQGGDLEWIRQELTVALS